MDALEIIWRLGSLGGIFSAAFLIYDRFIRIRPIVQFVMDEIFPGEAYYPEFEVRSRSEGDTWITSINVWPAAISIWKDHSVKSAVRSSLNKTFMLIIKGGEKKRLPVLLRENPSPWCFIIIHWRIMSNPSFPQLPVIKIVKPADLKALRLVDGGVEQD